MKESEQNLQILTSHSMPEEISLGQILKAKRQDLKMEIVEVSSYLKIKSNDIDAIESDDLSRVTKHLYIIGLIRSYARFLKIDEKLIEARLKILPVKSNVENKKHQLLNIGENTELTPDKDSFFNFLLISILLFLTLLSIYNSYENKSTLLTAQDLIEKLENIDSTNGGN